MNVYLGGLYKEVQYIQSSGTQYINTGFIPSNTSKIEISMGGWSQYQQYCDLFGARRTWSTSYSDGRGFHLGFERNNLYYYMFGVQGNFATSYLSFIDGNDHVIQMSSSGIYQDGTLKYTYNNYTFTSPVSWTIFALNDNGTVNCHSVYKLYYAKLWDNGTLVRDFVPCYRISDNEIGLYDKVNNQFYANSGTGTFTKGADVGVINNELKNAYIGDYIPYTPTSNTIAYFPFINDQLDKTGNYSLDTTGTKQTLGYSFTGATQFIYSGEKRDERFMCFWVKPSSTTGASLGFINVGGYRFQWKNSGSTNIAFVFKTSGGSFIDTGNLGTYSTDTWYFIAFGINSSNNYRAYINAVQKQSGTSSPASYDASYLIGGSGNGTTTFSDVIIEDRLWSATEVTNYYNQTKANYGL